MSIFVPPRAIAAMARQNLVNAILQHIAFEPIPGGGQRDREVHLTISDLKDAFDRLGVQGDLRNSVMEQLLRERIVHTDGTRVWIGDLSDLRAYLAKREGQKAVATGALA